jgi:hypothetical protein
MGKNMKLNKYFIAILIVFLSATSSASEEFREIDWDILVPADFQPDIILEKFGDFSELADDDPRVKEIMKELEAAYKAAPINKEMDGKKVKLPGFVVPLEGDGEKVSEFLLVPYYGACIHVPPPPANQTVYVNVSSGKAEIRNAFDVVWVTGTLSAKSFDHDLATAGYRLEAISVEPYE